MVIIFAEVSGPADPVVVGPVFPSLFGCTPFAISEAGLRSRPSKSAKEPKATSQRANGPRRRRLGDTQSLIFSARLIDSSYHPPGHQRLSRITITAVLRSSFGRWCRLDSLNNNYMVIINSLFPQAVITHATPQPTTLFFSPAGRNGVPLFTNPTTPHLTRFFPSSFEPVMPFAGCGRR